MRIRITDNAHAGRKPAINHQLLYIFLVIRPVFPKSLARFAMKRPGFLLAVLFSAIFLAVSPAWALTVVVDAGHGGQDRGGAPGQRIPEKPYTLDVALRLAATLRASGVRVVLTRDGDYFVGLRQRCDIANAQSNAVFVSVHFNGAPRTAADGVETYYYSGQSAALAASVHRRLLAATGLEDRHVRRRGFFVIRNTIIPAILIEPGFLSNPQTGERVSGSPAYRQSLAEAVARGIMDRYR
jgi:N-acetylmuramoyl-L-alanine amidase